MVVTNTHSVNLYRTSSNKMTPKKYAQLLYKLKFLDLIHLKNGHRMKSWFPSQITAVTYKANYLEYAIKNYYKNLHVTPAIFCKSFSKKKTSSVPSNPGHSLILCDSVNELHSKHNHVYCQDYMQTQVIPKSLSTLPEKSLILGSLLKRQ